VYIFNYEAVSLDACKLTLGASLAQFSRILDERPDAAPRRQHISSSHGDILIQLGHQWNTRVRALRVKEVLTEAKRPNLVEVVGHLFEDERDFLLQWPRLVREGGGSICRTADGVPFLSTTTFVRGHHAQQGVGLG
jgi:hypothetical protein